jgi:hypothetical protein
VCTLVDGMHDLDPALVVKGQPEDVRSDHLRDMQGEMFGELKMVS